MTDNGQQLSFQLGPEIIESYKRLSYTPWHALAEFVDNSTQSYFNNREELDEALENKGEKLYVQVTYDRDDDQIRVSDNSIGMSLEELRYALRVGAKPENQDGRSKFGLGLKTAACWLGNSWTLRTTKLGDTNEYVVTVDVAQVAAGNSELPTETRTGKNPDDHYTILEISQLNRKPQGRTLGKIREFLSSMYRVDLRDETLELYWQGEQLEWELSDDEFAHNRSGEIYRKDFDFDINGKHVSGWVGVLDRGSRAKAGFSILHADRVVKGWPDSWRPEAIFGQFQGSNDLVNQRLTGEIHLDDFEVTHTKDDILWFQNEQELVEDKLLDAVADYRQFAKQRRKGNEDENGPSDVEVQTAVEELEAELGSNELADLITIEDIVPPEALAESLKPVLEELEKTDPDFSAQLQGVEIAGYMVHDLHEKDPYVAPDFPSDDKVVVVVNMNHPHFKELKGADGVLNFLRHCVYDALAEWLAYKRTSNIAPDTVKQYKDQLLRVSMEIKMNEPA